MMCLLVLPPLVVEVCTEHVLLLRHILICLMLMYLPFRHRGGCIAAKYILNLFLDHAQLVGHAASQKASCIHFSVLCLDIRGRPSFASNLNWVLSGSIETSLLVLGLIVRRSLAGMREWECLLILPILLLHDQIHLCIGIMPRLDLQRPK